MSAKTLHQIQKESLDVLVENFSPDDAIRFLQIYETGSGEEFYFIIGQAVPASKDMHLDHEDLVVMRSSTGFFVIPIHIAQNRSEFFPVD